MLRNIVKGYIWFWKNREKEGQNVFRVTTDRAFFDFSIFFSNKDTETHTQHIELWKNKKKKKSCEMNITKKKLCMTTLLSIYLHWHFTLFIVSCTFFLCFLSINKKKYIYFSSFVLVLLCHYADKFCSKAYHMTRFWIWTLINEIICFIKIIFCLFSFCKYTNDIDLSYLLNFFH